MISVIICSRGPDYRQETVASIAATIGVPYELIVVDNSAGQYGICAAYNKGAAESKYNVLCFAHEDISFRTADWGGVVARILADQSVGALGVAGGKWLVKAPGTWWSCGSRYLRINLSDQDRNTRHTQHTYTNPENKPLVDVAAVDGLWLCTRKEVWEKHPFDEQTFSDFHFYDVDFCASLHPRYRVCVTFEIDITHYSRGSYNDSWMMSADRFYQKHVSQLPLGLSAVSSEEAQTLEHDICKSFLLQIIDRKLPARLGYKYLAACVRIRPFSRDTLWLVRHYAKFSWQNGGTSNAHQLESAATATIDRL